MKLFLQVWMIGFLTLAMLSWSLGYKDIDLYTWFSQHDQAKNESVSRYNAGTLRAMTFLIQNPCNITRSTLWILGQNYTHTYEPKYIVRMALDYGQIHEQYTLIQYTFQIPEKVGLYYGVGTFYFSDESVQSQTFKFIADKIEVIEVRVLNSTA